MQFFLSLNSSNDILRLPQTNSQNGKHNGRSTVLVLDVKSYIWKLTVGKASPSIGVCQGFGGCSLEFRRKEQVLATFEKQQAFHQVSQTVLDASALLIYRRQKEVPSDRLLHLRGCLLSGSFRDKEVLTDACIISACRS